MQTGRKTLFSERLATLAAERDMSALALSESAGVGRNLVGNYLKGASRTPQAKTVRRLAAALGVDPEYLTGETDVRRRAPDIAEGVGDMGEAAGIAEIVAVMEAELDATGGNLKAYHLAIGAAAFGVSRSSTILVSSATARSGDLVLTRCAEGRTAVRYYVEPYLVGEGESGRITHRLAGVDEAILGVVVAAMQGMGR